MRTSTYLLRRLSRAVAFLGLAAWGIGTLTVMIHTQADLFQRMGALGVAASVLFFTDQLGRIEQARQRTVETLLHEFGLALDSLRHGADVTELAKIEDAVDVLAEEQNFERLRRRADALNGLNVVLLTLTTLQWGFGDRWVNTMLVCGAPEC